MASPLTALRGESDRIATIRGQVAQLLARQTGSRRLPPILILGETGTGKGLLARSVHLAGPRRDGPFVDVNCAAIPETLLEAELFGYERGAFTDARQAKPGLFQTAHGGTIFLDEIGLLPVALQGKLLSALEDRAVRRLGSTRAEPVDIALVAATSVDLKRAVGEGTFRADLYHRLAVISLELPPLRARGADVLELAECFLARACADYDLSPRALTPDARDLLLAHPWPGNVRELANAMERAVLLSDTEAITAGMLDFLASEALPASEAAQAGKVADTAAEESLDAALRARVQAALGDHGGNIRRTAATLGISRNTLRARMDRYGLRHREGASGAGGTAPSPAPPTPPPAAPVQWERLHLSFLRAHVRSSGSFETARALELISEKVGSFGGRIEESGPTDVVAVFGLEPVDNAPSHAALAALAIQKATAHASADASNGPDVIVGIHCAEHLVLRHESTAHIGVDGKAATWSVLEALVAGDGLGTIVISGAVVPFLTRRFVLERVREANDTWRILRREDAPAAWSSPHFVGRTFELETLRLASARAEQGHGQIVGIAGDAGIGKSRLLREAVRRLPGWLVLASGGAPYATNTSYFPVVELLKRYWEIQDTDSVPQVREKIATTRPTNAGDATWLVAPILDVLGVLSPEDQFHLMDPQERRHRTHKAIKHVILAASTTQPLCLIVEDLHWIDAETQAILDLLAESISGSRVLLLVNYRPEYQHGWGSRSTFTQIRLDPLPADGVAELLDTLLGTDPTLGPLKQRLIDRTEGNPFFLEETVRTLVETKALEGKREAYTLVRPVESLQIPATVQTLLAARIDRLPKAEKQLLQAASVIGKDIPFAILTAASELPGRTVRKALGHLGEAEFLHEVPRYSDLEYTFKHALTQEVVYSSLLHDHQRALHAQIVAAVEQLYSHRLTEHYERLAHHALRGELWEKALQYSRRAGAKALARSAYREAAESFKQALAALSHLPARRDTIEKAIDVRTRLYWALFPVAEYDPLPSDLEVAERLAKTLGDEHRLGTVSALFASLYFALGQYDRAVEYGDRAHAIGVASEDPILQLQANFFLGQAHHALGDYRRARDVFTKNTEPPPVGLIGHIYSSLSSAWLAWALAELGEFSSGIARAEAALNAAETLGDQFSLANALGSVGIVRVVKGDLHDAILPLERCLALSHRMRNPTAILLIAAFLGYSYALSGRLGEALALLERPVGQAERGIWYTLEAAFISQAYLQGGRIEDALERARLALDLSREHRERGHEAYVLRVLGEIHEHRGRADAEIAEHHYHQALALAETLRMRPLIAHCHAGLGKLYRHTTKRIESDEHLATAATMYRQMGMLYWLEQTEREMRELA